jgi:hypothetical protein
MNYEQSESMSEVSETALVSLEMLVLANLIFTELGSLFNSYVELTLFYLKGVGRWVDSAQIHLHRILFRFNFGGRNRVFQLLQLTLNSCHSRKTALLLVARSCAG